MRETETKPAKDIKVADYILTDKGPEQVIEIKTKSARPGLPHGWIYLHTRESYLNPVSVPTFAKIDKIKKTF